MKWLCLLVGFFGGVAAAFLEYQKQNSDKSGVQDVKVFTESTTATKINAESARSGSEPTTRLDVESRGKEIDLEDRY